ncbi:hypothetical protein CAP31_09800 [Sulfuriferula sp. AH1]|uniref:DUF3501 family protein n=1 Tax=Sulfuriferula sp. AH1 TaxID=1985873 RepID=UPI000B3B2390|nr:hypothetical protein CAP31_09800 [Sulfuriferula sp. AH1]
MSFTRESLLTLEAYAKARPAMREQVMAAKKLRRVFLNEHVVLIFENALLIHYQIQEMLRVEKIFEEDGIRHEFDSFAPLVPDGSNLKATMQIEYADDAQRKKMLALLKGIEDRVWMRVAGFEPVFAIADEDIERENAEKTAAVHFLRFEFTAPMIAALKAGAALGVGVDHPHCQAVIDPLADAVRAALCEDFESGL